MPKHFAALFDSQLMTDGMSDLLLPIYAARDCAIYAASRAHYAPPS